MDMRIPPVKLKILLESNPLKSRILVRGLAVLSGVLAVLAGSAVSGASPPGCPGSGCEGAALQRTIYIVPTTYNITVQTHKHMSM